LSAFTEKVGSLLVIVAILAGLELVVHAGLLDERHFPPPTEVADALVDQMGDPALAEEIGQTLQGWGLGLALAAALALPLGIAIGCSQIAYRVLRGPIELMRPVPSVAFVPLVVLTLGSGLEGKVFLVAFAAFWPLLIHAIYGVRGIDPLLLETARSLGIGPLTRFGRIVVPGAMPYVATGLRTASAIALILSVTAEIVIGAPGLGHSISLAGAAGATPDMYGLIAVAGALGWGLNALLSRLERRVLPWRAAWTGVEE
jgi:ABC-type nitrate/sulfonate/bicarbonate transport system permease component